MRQILINFAETMRDFIDKVLGLGFPDTIDELIAFARGLVFDVIRPMSPIYIILFGALAAIFAFAGYKLFKVGLYGIGAVGLAYAARYLAPFVVGFYQGYLPAGFDGTVVLMLVAAVIGAILARFARKFLVLCLGGGCGYLIGSGVVAGLVADYFNTLDFLKGDIAKIAFGVVCAAICGIIFLLIFQHAWIILSSLGGMAFAGLLLGILIMPEAGKEIWLYFIGGGAAIGIISIIHQYQVEARENDIFYSFTL